MTAPIALDTSVAVPLLVQTHGAHDTVVRWWGGREITLSGHAAVETYSVLTCLPGDLRLAPADAARLLDERFAPPLLLGTSTAERLPQVLSAMGIAGGAAYDALVALAAAEHGTELATRDARAKATYDAVGVRVVVVA
ncbi:MAG: type II toxin-antitoxin system VapC family toxin [Pseudonocardia sp.]|nr:type II toxin-antitoxin system VapC family toxin [Pseudonocardia sp.]